MRWKYFVVAVCAMFCTVQANAQGLQQFGKFLQAGEFGPARRFANGVGDKQRRDQMLRDIAISQALSGARRGSVSTAGDIGNDRLRNDAFNNIGRQPMARGGAAAADFDSLIELIQSTTAQPEPGWKDEGGTGTVEEFRGGVYVDARGILRKIRHDRSLSLSNLHRQSWNHSTNATVRKSSRLRKVSLVRLEKEIQKLRALGQSPDNAMKVLAGIYKIEYVLVYPKSGDVVVAGPASDWHRNVEGRLVSKKSGAPALQLDDLVVVLRNAFDGRGEFGCSIEPTAAGLRRLQEVIADPKRATVKRMREAMGRQQIVVSGVDPRTRVARVVVEADYHMKLVGLGIEKGTLGLTSYMDLLARRENPSRSGTTMLRWWFTANYNSIQANQARSAFQFNGQGVQVQSENEFLAAGGKRVRTGRSDTLNKEFAASFTSHFNKLASRYPIYAELRNIYDLATVAALMKQEDMPGQVGWSMSVFRSPQLYQVKLGAAPKEVESVVTRRTFLRGNKRHIVKLVSGGVTVDARPVVKKQIGPDAGILEVKLSSQRPRGRQWWWD